MLFVFLTDPQVRHDSSSYWASFLEFFFNFFLAVASWSWGPCSVSALWWQYIRWTSCLPSSSSPFQPAVPSAFSTLCKPRKVERFESKVTEYECLTELGNEQNNDAKWCAPHFYWMVSLQLVTATFLVCLFGTASICAFAACFMLSS